MSLMYLPLVIYNAWILENYAAGACADGGRPVITLRRLMFRFILIIIMSVLSSRYFYYLEFVGWYISNYCTCLRPWPDFATNA